PIRARAKARGGNSSLGRAAHASLCFVPSSQPSGCPQREPYSHTTKEKHAPAEHAARRGGQPPALHKPPPCLPPRQQYNPAKPPMPATILGCRGRTSTPWHSHPCARGHRMWSMHAPSAPTHMRYPCAAVRPKSSRPVEPSPHVGNSVRTSRLLGPRAFRDRRS